MSRKLQVDCTNEGAGSDEVGVDVLMRPCAWEDSVVEVCLELSFRIRLEVCLASAELGMVILEVAYLVASIAQAFVHPRKLHVHMQ